MDIAEKINSEKWFDEQFYSFSGENFQLDSISLKRKHAKGKTRFCFHLNIFEFLLIDKVKFVLFDSLCLNVNSLQVSDSYTQTEFG